MCPDHVNGRDKAEPHRSSVRLAFFAPQIRLLLAWHWQVNPGQLACGFCPFLDGLETARFTNHPLGDGALKLSFVPSELREAISMPRAITVAWDSNRISA
ncbi:hypothetical protein HRR83_005298 [Exophiala dermatitidis]|uniref:Uncharacterized protein n=1 Tax=Exophiala dermatitidis TaxID=5970 RepID=A0AAN6EUE3_EXODE|nr:hypothetical protein HRR74_005150 [Exophiala dermatitidis]KAJ4518601.1 hypothetical protein HRR73_004182 [Exophiala dermatitidis]KAJ4534111.1 hypothetical protein HRR76_006048 [Exophiala dermatitidis]KAJ4550262.1 hypothetical protein HRR77_003733 [Exophiala dermatitidis]KAJ4571497.1 hypothetical protein HRR81_005528 [Exophiala dermatitidis]